MAGMQTASRSLHLIYWKILITAVFWIFLTMKRTNCCILRRYSELTSSRFVNYSLTIPATSAPYERHSALKRIKAHLRNSRSQNRLSGLRLKSTGRATLKTDILWLRDRNCRPKAWQNSFNTNQRVSGLRICFHSFISSTAPGLRAGRLPETPSLWLTQCCQLGFANVYLQGHYKNDYTLYITRPHEKQQRNNNNNNNSESTNEKWIKRSRASSRVRLLNGAFRGLSLPSLSGSWLPPKSVRFMISLCVIAGGLTGRIWWAESSTCYSVAMLMRSALFWVSCGNSLPRNIPEERRSQVPALLGPPYVH
jgi:hypothetical protein